MRARTALSLLLALTLNPFAFAAAPAPASPQITPEQWDADIAMRLGEHAYLGGDMPAALAAFRSASYKDPTRADAYWRAGHCLTLMDRIPEALKALEKARSLAPQDARILNTLAVLQMKSGDVFKATEVAKRAVTQAPRVADVWDTLGQAYFASGDLVRARTAFETALRLDPGHESARRGLAKLR